MKHLRVLSTALICLAVLPAAAGTDGMQPGMWEYNIKMEMPGMPFAMPPVVTQQCLTQQDVDKGQAYRDQNQKGECQMSNLKQSAGKISYDIACTGKQPATGHFDFNTTASALNGVGTMDMSGQKMKQTFAAKRVGDCK